MATPSTIMATKIYASTGQCVFCLEPFSPGSLTDEHIIPRALNGSYILKKGTCVECAAYCNKRFEQLALNTDLLVPRIMLELRRRKKTEKKLPLLGLGNEGSEDFRWVEAQAVLYPPIITLIMFQSAGLLSGVDRGGNLSNLSIQDYFLPRGLGALEFSSFTMRQPHRHTEFSLSIAKMAYCFAVGELGVGGFDGGDIRDLIMGRREDNYNFVGGISQEEQLSQAHLHGLYLRTRGEFLTTIVHLFASCKMKPYEVVVGKIPKSIGTT
ncbi:HNH endonuclease [Rhizobium leguminosarum]|uniref:HNH endonuclease n=1 Tax=Rhizobium leguminosarum TaxID=384 RepID=UPI003F9B1342